MTAALGVILDTESRTQTIFGGGEELPLKQGKRIMVKQQIKGQYGHNDDITALAISDDRTKVVTGSTGREPMIFVWDAQTGERLHLFRLPPGSRSVSALAFNPSATKIAAADLSDDYGVHFFTLAENTTQSAKFKSDRNMIQMLRFYPDKTDKVISVSTSSIYTWSKEGNASKHTGGATNMSYSAVAFSKTGIAFTAAADGKVYKWKGTSSVGKP